MVYIISSRENVDYVPKYMLSLSETTGEGQDEGTDLEGKPSATPIEKRRHRRE